MSKQTVLNAITQLFNKDIKKSPVGTEIARLIFLTRAWSVKSLTLQGATDRQTMDNINAWLNDFDVMFRTNMVNIDTLSGFGGWALARLPGGESLDKELFLESYRTTIGRLANKDLTQAALLRNSLALRFKNNWRSFYDAFDIAVKEGTALGLTSQEITTGFMNTGIFHNNVSLIDSAGRLWKPERYNEMYARTRASEIQDDLLREEMISLGMDIVRVSDHNTETPICKQFEGKFYSLTGKPGVPTLQIKPPFHPNCLHFLIPDNASIKEIQVTNTKQNVEIKSFNKDLSTSAKSTVKKQKDWNIENRN